MKPSYVDPRQAPAIERANLRRLLRLLRPFRGAIALVFACILAGTLLDLTPSLLIKQVVDRAIPARDVNLLAWLAAGMIAAPLAADLFGIGEKYLANWIGEHLMLDLRGRLYGHFLRQDLGYFGRLKPGEALSRILNDVEGAGSAVQGTLFGILDNVIVLVSTLVVLFALDARLAGLSLVMLPLFILPSRRVARLRKQLKRQAQIGKAELTGILSETLSISGALLLQVFGAEEQERERFRAKARQLLDLSLRQTLVGREYQVLMGLLKNLGPALVFGFGGWLVMRGEAPLGTLVAFAGLLRKLYAPATALVGVHVDLVVAHAYFDRVFEVLDLEPAIQSPPDARRLPRLRGELRLADVSFHYSPDHPTLSDIDLTIAPGAMVALVGASGAGKSTLAMLVPRLYDPTAGALLLDGHDLRTLDLAWLRRQIAVVTQETYLMHQTVLENLRYGRPDADLPTVMAAARAAQIHDLIAGLPEGYDTVAGDRGHRFSGGERQRLAIARALLKDPRILILDEATSSLDAHSEALVQSALEGLMVGRTSLVIAHRLSTVLAADEILVLEGGRIVERGRHAALLEAGGAYAALVRQQAQDRPSA